MREKTKENLNMEKEKTKEMEELEKKDYKALQKYIRYSRAAIKLAQERKSPLISSEDEERMINLNYIQWAERPSNNLHHPDYFITKDGYKEYCRLEEKYKKDITLYAAIGAVLIALISLYYTYQSNKDFSNAINLINQTISSMLKK